MTSKRQMRLIATRQGRIVIHIISCIKDHHLAWHLRGIYRDLIGI